jgi:glycosyltransferase involved in cell wall biosynthesis
MVDRGAVMKICLIGDFSDNLDEGYKNTSHYLAKELEQRHTVVRLNAKHVGTSGFWRSFTSAAPQIIHTIAQPTDQSLILTRLMQRYWPQARTVVSALGAERYFADGTASLKQRLVLRAARPDLTLVQTSAAERMFKQLDCQVAQLPNGVDTERFRPVSQEQKRVLRATYGIDHERPVALHVGHLRAARNLTALQPLLARQIQVVVAGSLYMGTNHEFIQQLEQAGFRILKGYQPRIEELYMLADCYIFPTQPGVSITMPLSVLEAMACNLPVITTRFVGLVQAFAPGGGLTFIDDADDIPALVDATLASAQQCTTRRMVQAMSWQAVADRLESYYDRILAA